MVTDNILFLLKNLYRMIYKYFFLLLFLLGFSGIARSQDKGLSSLDSLIYKKRSFNTISKNGFRIQLYNGDEKTALERIEKFREEFPEIKVMRTYKVPEWKVQTEIYKTRLEADRVLNSIKEKYPGARVL